MAIYAELATSAAKQGRWGQRGSFWSHGDKQSAPRMAGSAAGGPNSVNAVHFHRTVPPIGRNTCQSGGPLCRRSCRRRVSVSRERPVSGGPRGPRAGQALEREAPRKNKALAEAAALLVLVNSKIQVLRQPSHCSPDVIILTGRRQTFA